MLMQRLGLLFFFSFLVVWHMILKTENDEFVLAIGVLFPLLNYLPLPLTKSLSLIFWIYSVEFRYKSEKLPGVS